MQENASPPVSYYFHYASNATGLSKALKVGKRDNSVANPHRLRMTTSGDRSSTDAYFLSGCLISQGAEA
jgi:hypothetical protein